MKITTTLEWTRCDGTPATLPGDYLSVLVHSPGGEAMYAQSTGYLVADSHRALWVFHNAIFGVTEVQPGDWWAYFPELPEVSQ